MYTRLIRFKLEAPLHQRDVRVWIKMHTPELVLKIGKLPILSIPLQIWRFEKLQPPKVLHKLCVAAEVDEGAPIDLDTWRVILEQRM